MTFPRRVVSCGISVGSGFGAIRLGLDPVEGGVLANDSGFSVEVASEVACIQQVRAIPCAVVPVRAGMKAIRPCTGPVDCRELGFIFSADRSGSSEHFAKLRAAVAAFRVGIPTKRASQQGIDVNLLPVNHDAPMVSLHVTKIGCTVTFVCGPIPSVGSKVSGIRSEVTSACERISRRRIGVLGQEPSTDVTVSGLTRKGTRSQDDQVQGCSSWCQRLLGLR